MNLKRIDKNRPVALYYQLKTIIREKIETEEWNPGEKIPSEAFLSEHNQISPMTVRQATNELCDEGFLYKVRGKGTFVSKPKLERDLSELTSQSEKLKERGYNIDRKVLDLRRIPATKHVAEKLEINRNEDVLTVDRLMIFEGKPFYHEINFLPHQLCGSLMAEDFAHGSIYRLLEDKLRMDLDYANVTIEAVPCEAYQSKLLGIRKGSPVVRLSQNTHLIDGRPIHYLEAVARSDIYKFTLVRKRKRA